jgi:hypothetical protein
LQRAGAFLGDRLITKTLALAALAAVLPGAPTLAFADPTCVAQATDKKLAGASGE